MIAIQAESPVGYREQMALLRRWKRPLRLFAYLFLLYLLTPIVFGLVFTIMLFPLLSAFVHLAAVNTPAYHLLGRVLGAEGLPARLAKPPSWVTIYSFVFIVLQLGLLVIFLRLLFFVGFCHQNLVCMSVPFILK